MYDYDRRLRLAMEHATPEAKQKYLKDHPGADPKNHSVSKGKGQGTAKGGPNQRQKDIKSLTQGYKTDDPYQEQQIKKLQQSAKKLDKLETEFADLNPDDRWTKQRTIDKEFDEYSKLMEDTFGSPPKKPWYYGL